MEGKEINENEKPSIDHKKERTSKRPAAATMFQNFKSTCIADCKKQLQMPSTHTQNRTDTRGSLPTRVHVLQNPFPGIFYRPGVECRASSLIVESVPLNHTTAILDATKHA